MSAAASGESGEAGVLGVPAPPERSQPLQVAPTSPPGSVTTVLVVAAAAIAALYLGRDVFIPLALSILISFALAPIVTRLRRLYLGRVPSVLLVVVTALVFLSAFAWLLAAQAITLAQSLPQHELNLRQKIQMLDPGAGTSGVFDRTADMLRRMSQELSQATGQSPQGAAGTPGEEARRPIPVEVHEPPSSPLATLLDVAGFLAEPLATAGIMLLFVVFVLLQREDLRDRFIRLFGSTDVHRTTQAMTDATERIGRYLLMQLLLNMGYGILFGAGLYLIGVPNALLWGMIGAVLRFIPYVGAVLSMLFPLVLAMAVDTGWTMPILVVILFVVIESGLAYGVEPLLYGSTTGLSPAAVVIVTVFWTVLWGPVGLLLATPLTACVVVLGRYVPQLHFLEVAFGNQEVLSPSLKVYQRLLADDSAEAAEVADEYQEKNGLQGLYGEILLPVLGLIELDRQRGALDRARQQAIADDLVEIADEAQDETVPHGPRIACIPSRSGLDAAAAKMASNLLCNAGYRAEVVQLSDIGRIRLERPALIYVAQLNGSTLVYVKRVIRRLRAQLGTDMPIVLGLANATPDRAQDKEVADKLGVTRLAIGPGGMLAAVRDLAGEPGPPPAEPVEAAAAATPLGLAAPAVLPSST